MAGLIEVELRSTYTSDLEATLRSEQKRITEFHAEIQKEVFDKPFRLNFDLTGAKEQAKAIRAAMAQELGGMGGGILGPDGRAMPSSSAARSATTELNAAAGQLSQTITMIGNRMASVSETVLKGPGRFETTIERYSKDGKAVKSVETIQRDESNVAGHKAELAALAQNGDNNAALAMAKSKGDVRGQIALLSSRKQELAGLMERMDQGGLRGSSVWNTASTRDSALDKAVATLQGKLVVGRDKEYSAARTDSVSRTIAAKESEINASDKLLKADMARAGKIADIQQREQALNALYQQRIELYRQGAGFFDKMDTDLRREGRGDLAHRAFNRVDNMVGAGGQAELDRQRMLADSGKKISDQRAKEDENQRRERVAGEKRALQEEMAGRRRTTLEAVARQKARESMDMASARRQEERDIIRQKGRDQRAKIFGGASGGMESLASRSGEHEELARAARNAASAYRVKAMKEAEASLQASGNNAGGHAMDFHSSSLLRNAGTYLRWQLPMQAVQGVMGAFSSGFEEAVKTERQFATLQAVFRGTREEAKLLRDGILDLARENGRSTEEAMTSAVNWARMGLTRVQVQDAVRVSLIASNVAQISSAEASEKLRAVVESYKMNVGELPALLGELTSMTQRYGVTMKDLFDGMERASGVLKQFGMSASGQAALLTSLISNSGASGSEAGNSIKFIAQRITKPQVTEKLRKEFGVDLHQSNGDLKSLDDILNILSKTFSGLNSAERQAFLELTAGSRQAARFAIILENNTTRQVAEAEASFQMGSAMSANNLVLETMEAKLNRIHAAWTKIFVGIMDGNLGKILKDAVTDLDDFLKHFDKKQAGSPGGKGSIYESLSPGQKEAVQEAKVGQKNGGINRFAYKLEGVMGGDGLGKPPLSDDEVRAAQKYMEEKGWAEAGSVKEAVGHSEQSSKDSLAGASSAQDQARISKLEDLRGKAEGMRKNVDIFRGMSETVSEGHVSPENMIKDFNQAKVGLEHLENGFDLSVSASKRFNDAINGGDTKAAAAVLLGLSKAFTSPAEGKKDEYLKTRAETIDVFTREVENAEKELAGVRDAVLKSHHGKEDEEKMQHLIDLVKTLQGELAVAKHEMQETKTSAFSEDEGKRIKDYIDNVSEQSKMFGDMISHLGIDEKNDPISRIYERRLKGIFTVTDALRAQGDVDHRAADVAIAEAQARLGLADESYRTHGMSPEEHKSVTDREKGKIAKWEESKVMADAAWSEANDEAQKQRKRLDKERPDWEKQRSFETGAHHTEMESEQYRYGGDESESRVRQADAMFAKAEALMSKYKNHPDKPQLEVAYDQGSLIEAEKIARQDIESLEQRAYALERQKGEVMAKQTKELRDQRDEVGKKLLLASREDQLRAAVMSRTLRDKGRIGENQFFMLSENSRKAMVEYSPDQAPTRTNAIREKAMKELRDIKEEQRVILANTRRLQAEQNQVEEAIRRATGRRGAMDIPDEGDPKKPRAEVAHRDQMPTVNVGDVNVTVRLADEFRTITEGIIQRSIKQEVGALRSWVESVMPPPIPSAHGATGN